jgi:hypothetical protein
MADRVTVPQSASSETSPGLAGHPGSPCGSEGALAAPQLEMTSVHRVDNCVQIQRARRLHRLSPDLNRSVGIERVSQPRQFPAHVGLARGVGHSSRPRRRGLGALAGLSCLVLGADQASALPQVQMAPPPRFLPVQAANPVEPTAKSSEQPGADQQAPLTELNDVLEATRARLDELFGATQSMAGRRAETELLRQENERLAGELEQVNGRLAELESSSKRAEAEIAHLANANDVAAQNLAGLDEELAAVRQQNADLEARLADADSAGEAAAATVEKTRAEMQQAIERSRAEAQRLNSELTAAKGQVGEATTAVVEAERARQQAVRETQQLRGEAERAHAELVAAHTEIERFRAANGEPEQRIASLNADSQSAMDTARQTLSLMEEKIGALSAALAEAGLAALAEAGLTEARPAPTPKLNSAAIADERSAATATPSGKVQAAPQKRGDTGGADQRADIAGQGPTTAPAHPDDTAGLVLFDDSVRYLNSEASEASGADLFSGIELPGDGVVHVSTTAAWQNIPPAGQRDYLDVLFDLWTIAREGSGPAVVRIVDPNGRVLLEKSDRDQPRERAAAAALRRAG